MAPPRRTRDGRAGADLPPAQLYQDFVDKFHFLQRNLQPRLVSLKDVPEELRRKFVGQSERVSGTKVNKVCPGVHCEVAKVVRGRGRNGNRCHHTLGCCRAD